MKYEFKCFETDVFGQETNNMISTSFHADTLDSVLEKFEYFLKGNGFHFDGRIDIVKEDDPDLETFKINIDNDSDTSFGDRGPNLEHSPFYYDVNRNRPFGEWRNYTAGSNDWDTGASQPTMNIDLSDSLFDNYEIKIDSSNVFYTQFDMMAGYPHER